MYLGLNIQQRNKPIRVTGFIHSGDFSSCGLHAFAFISMLGHFLICCGPIHILKIQNTMVWSWGPSVFGINMTSGHIMPHIDDMTFAPG